VIGHLSTRSRSVADGPAVDAPERARRGAGLGDLLARYALVGVFVLVVLVFSLLRPATFPTSGNAVTTLTSQEVMLILALAVTLPLRIGDFDISVAAVMVLSATVSAHLAHHRLPLVLTLVVALALGAAVGLLNAALTVLVGINAFIVTLGTMTVLDGASYALTNGEVLNNFSGSIIGFARDNVFGIPLGVYFGWLLAAGLWYIYEYTPWGRYLLFIGGNKDVSRLAGVPVQRIRILAFVGAGMLAGFAGVLLAGSLGAVDSSISAQYLLPPYAAAFLSTAVVQLGRFNVIGTIIGLYLLAVGITGLELLGVAPWVGDVFNGGALLLAVLFAAFAGRYRGMISRKG
jgi:ribose transport system permease protein